MLNKLFKSLRTKRARARAKAVAIQTGVLVLITLTLIGFAPAVKAQPIVAAPQLSGVDNEPAITATVTAAQADNRALALTAYLKSKNSELADYAVDIVADADKYGIDYKLIPAIAGNESGFAKAMVPGTYNAWGWGGGYIPFKSWPNAIDQISQGLAQNYIGKGRVTPEQIAPVYAPPSRTWAYNVQMYENQIANFK